MMPSQKLGSDCPSTASERARVVVAGAAPDGGDDPDRDPGDDGQHHGAERQLERRRQPLLTTRRAGARYWKDWPKSPWKTLRRKIAVLDVAEAP